MRGSRDPARFAVRVDAICEFGILMSLLTNMGD